MILKGSSGYVVWSIGKYLLRTEPTLYPIYISSEQVCVEYLLCQIIFLWNTSFI